MGINNYDFQKVSETWELIKNEMSKVLVGQEAFVDRLLLAMSVQGHVLVEGLPGLAKTLTIKLLGKVLHTAVSRIQFTPDLLPADVTGTMIYNQAANTFQPHKGPIFSHFVIADEINRASAKVQSALLQAMEEQSVTLGNTVMNLPRPFLVLATQNPIEQEGTYELPEAQLDRFLFKLEVEYPNKEEEMAILSRVDKLSLEEVNPKGNINELVRIGKTATQVKVDESILRYIVQIISSTRRAGVPVGMQDRYIEYGASPRASISILKCARVLALLNKRDFVIPDDIKEIAPDILRHRVILSFDALGSGVNTNSVVKTILNNVNVPK